jgi:hypothetical protein
MLLLVIQTQLLQVLLFITILILNSPLQGILIWLVSVVGNSLVSKIYLGSNSNSTTSTL